MLVKKVKPVLVIALVVLSVYWLSFWAFKKPLVELRFLSCFDSQLPLDVLEVYSNSGCGYSQIGYSFFRPFFLLPLVYYRFVVVLFYLALIVLNFFIIKQVASHFKVDFVSLLFLSVFLLNPLSNEVSTIFVSFTLINIGLFFFLHKSFFFSGFFFVLSSFRIQPVILFFSLCFMLLVYGNVNLSNGLSFSLRKNGFRRFLLFFSGGVVVLILLLFDSLYIQNLVFNSILNSGIQWSNFFNFKYIFYLVSFFFILKGKKSLISWAYIFCFPVVFWSALTIQLTRYLDMFALIHVVLFISSFNKKKLLTFLVVLFAAYNVVGLFINYHNFMVRGVLDEQIMLVHDDAVILSDYFTDDDFLLKYDVHLFADSYPYTVLRSVDKASPEVLRGVLNKFIDDKGVDVIAVGSAHHESSLMVNLSFYDEINSSKIPFMDHDCLICRHVSTIMFNNESAYSLFKERLDAFWVDNYARLCDASPFYYGIARQMLDLPPCTKVWDWLIVLDDVKTVLESVLYGFMFLLLLPKLKFDFKISMK